MQESKIGATSKRETLLNMLDRGMTMLHLDARVDGVDVPPQLRDDYHLRLNLSYRFNLDILEITDRGVRADLSFGGHPYLCLIPFAAVFGMLLHHSGDHRVWPDDMPRELVEQASQLAQQLDDEPATPDEPVGPAVRRVGHLRVIK